jgi:hypothetical protein
MMDLNVEVGCTTNATDVEVADEDAGFKTL